MTRFFACLALVSLLLTGCSLSILGSADADPQVLTRADALKIDVSVDGLYRLTRDQLVEAGLALDDQELAQLSLSTGDRVVPFLVDNGALVFYGQATDDRYIANRSYILRLGAPGELMARDEPVASGPTVDTISHTVVLEENRIYTSNARSADNDNVWFWKIIQPASSVTISATLPVVGSGGGTLALQLYSTSYDRAIENDHDLTLRVNDRPVADLQWDGEGFYETTVSLASGTLHQGLNSITFDNTAPGATFIDISQLDRVTLTYDTPPVAVDDRLRLAGAAGTVQATGFSGPPLVVDVTDPAAPAIVGETAFAGGRLTVALAAGRELLAVGPGGFRRPVDVRPLRDTTWDRPENQADLIIITTDSLISALDPLVEARQAQGLTVAVVPIGEIYDRFGAGAATPESIRTFLQFAAASWQPPAPRYLLLVGDATYDYRGYTGPEPLDNVPSLMVPVAYSGETVSDTRLVDLDNDLRPDLAVGRWPVSSANEVKDLVKRTLAYETGTASSEIIFAADGTEKQFGDISDRYLERSNLTSGQNVSRLYGATADEVTQVWNQGSWLVTYTGHGSIDKWGKEDVMTVDAAANVGGAQTPPIVLQFTCLSGFFAHPRNVSLSESLLLADDGPVLLLGASSLTLSTHQEPLAVNLLIALQDPANLRIGDALQAAKRDLDVTNSGIREVSDTFGLIGDPSALINRP